MVRFVQQETKFLGACPSDEPSLLRRIELCGRVAYKSEGKITDESASQFVSNMLNSGHHSVLEHSNIALGVRGLHSDKLYRVMGRRLAYHPIFYQDHSQHCIISGNVRAWLDTMKHLGDGLDANGIAYRNYLGCALKENFPSIFGGLYFDGSPIGMAPIISLTDQLLIADCDIPAFTFKIVCDRGISHELVRHRVMSVTQESTRYCNYSEDITYILNDDFAPYWDQFTCRVSGKLMPKDVLGRFWLYEADYLEYREHVKAGIRPQIARDVLPSLLKTELYLTGRWSWWKNFIILRRAMGAHPRIRELAMEIEASFQSIGLTVED